MGIPASGKNIFPSNIQGMPTWYTIRISEKGYFARVEKSEIVVAMNPATLVKEMESVLPGGVFFYTDDLTLPSQRDDITIYPMAVKKIMKESEIPTNLRTYIANMVYVGVVAQMLNISLDAISEAIDFHFGGKQSAVESNFAVIKRAAEWAEQNLVKNDPFYVVPSDKTKDWIMADGNTAGAIGSIFGGIQLTAWYPITPASSLRSERYP